ncbi:hypothetical protein E2C01_090262 [Portunus trituberculatus]|uniref:Uncharacterized protein n=1 Tax=Portunus trituberculatus TaxID=210409 RepID=A0A5B7JPM7_PORTR|nr:hypothetical protein [Portunus trituberculatus]
MQLPSPPSPPSADPASPHPSLAFLIPAMPLTLGKTNSPGTLPPPHVTSPRPPPTSTSTLTLSLPHSHPSFLVIPVRKLTPINNQRLLKLLKENERVRVTG